MAGESVWILPRTDGPEDAHGNVSAAWPSSPADPGAVEVEKVKVAPQTGLAGEAAIADRETVVTNFQLLFPPDARLPGPQDHMWVRGHVYDVIGETGVWVNPWTNREAGSEVYVERTGG